MSVSLQVGLALLLAVLAGYIEHRKNVAPHLEIERKRTYLFGYACDEVFEELRHFDPTARMNVMELDPRLPGQEPVFKTIYALGMDGAPDADLGLRASQGVCGQAVSEGEFTVADLQVEDSPDVRPLRRPARQNRKAHAGSLHARKEDREPPRRDPQHHGRCFGRREHRQ